VRFPQIPRGLGVAERGAGPSGLAPDTAPYQPRLSGNVFWQSLLSCHEFVGRLHRSCAGLGAKQKR